LEDEVKELLLDPNAPVPFEYYATSFAAFAAPWICRSHSRMHVRRLLLDSTFVAHCGHLVELQQDLLG
jgi:hypothetical protein